MLQQLWNKFATTGLHEQIEEREFIKIRVLNQLCMLAIIIAAILFFVILIATQDFYVASLNWISASFGLFILLLHQKRFFNAARYVACFGFPLWVTIAIFYVKSASIGESTIFLITSLIAFIQYEGQIRHKTICLIWNLGLLTCVLAYISQESSVLWNPSGFAVLIIGLIFGISFIITFYQNDIRTIVKQKDNLVKQLQLKNTELERFAYITSHDLKEPVKNIEGFAGILKKELGKEGATERFQLANMIYDAAKRMYILIDSILKFSRLEKDGLQLESVDLNAVIQQFKHSHSHFLKDKKAIIQHNDLPLIQGNKVSISLLFQNLIENAIKYNESDIPSVKIFAHREKNNIRLVINDNGIGIKEEYTTYVFEPFRRLHNRSKYAGTGLGLAICKKIVENHSGKIWVESDNTGSQFNILLPTNK